MAELVVEILGSGGAVRTPRPGCQCECCRKARRFGTPWARMGPSVFVHGPDVLIDTPEDACFQVDRAGLDRIAAGLYSHWHPDHTAGRRIWETRNADFFHVPSNPECTPIYLPPHVWRDFELMDIMPAFRYKEHAGWVKLHLMDTPLDLGGWRITAHPVAETYVYAFLFEEIEGKRRMLIAMDELFGWQPPAHLCHLDLAIVPKGLFEFNPFSGERMIPAEHRVLASEATYIQTIEIVEQLAARKVVLMHLEEPERFSPSQYDTLSINLRVKRGWDVTFAFDGLMIQL